MAAKDIYHDIVKRALISDGWTITSDPYVIRPDKKTKYEVDLSADKVIAANKQNEKIAVEIKSFIGQSIPYEFHNALGQFLNYFVHIKNLDTERVLFLAISERTHKTLLTRPSLINVLEFYKVHLIIFDETTEKIKQWIKY